MSIASKNLLDPKKTKNLLSSKPKRKRKKAKGKGKGKANGSKSTKRKTPKRSKATGRFIKG